MVRHDPGRERPTAQERPGGDVREHRRERHREQRVDGKLLQDQFDAERTPGDAV